MADPQPSNPVQPASGVTENSTAPVQSDQQPSNPGLPASGFTTIGKELSETAPFWRVYRDEVRNHDRDVTFDEWNKTLDILLIFAGLFSAVVTSFLIASFPLLTPHEADNDAVVSAIHALAMAINSSITLQPSPPEPVTASALWINGLWFTSLFVALAVAFFAILAKQWLVEYNHRMAEPPTAVAASSSPRSHHAANSPLRPVHTYVAPDVSDAPPAQPLENLDALAPTASLAWARRRQFFFSAFTDWHIPVLITQVLPFLLHVALFLFLVGLSVFVWTLNRRIARGISALTGVLFSLYFIATVLPVFREDCPTATPLVRRAREAPTWIAIKAVQLWSIILPIALRAFGPRVTLHNVDGTLDQLRRRQKHIRDSGWAEGGGTTDDEVKLDTLQWLILVSGSETAVTAAFQALGALPPDSRFLPALMTITAGMDTAIERLGNSLVPPTAVEIVRAVRSELILGRGSWDLPLLGLDLPSSFMQILRDSQHPDARLLSGVLDLSGNYGTSSERSSASLRLYEITDALLKGDIISDTCEPAAQVLLLRPGTISVSAFACLSVLLTRSHDDSDKALIFRILQSRGLIEKLRRTLTCEPYKRPSMLQDLCYIVHSIMPKSSEVLSPEDEISLLTFISSLISLCRDLLPWYSDERSWDALDSYGLVPEIGACLGRLNPSNWTWVGEIGEQFFDIVNTALRIMDGRVANKEEFTPVLHLAQHCLELDAEWTRREQVGEYLDARRMEELLVQKGPCTKCTKREGSEAKWSDWVLDELQARWPTVEQSPQPDPSALTASHSDSSSVAASYLDSPSMAAITLDFASPLAAAAIPNAGTASPIASAPIPILQAATGSEAVSSSVVRGVFVPLADAGLASAASEETPAVDAPSGTTPPLITGTSLSPPATSRATTALTRAYFTSTSPGEVDDLGSGVISHREPAPRGDETSDPPSIAPHPLVMDVAPSPDAMETLESDTLSRTAEIPGAKAATTLLVRAALDSETASSIEQYHYEPVIQAPRARNASPVSSQVHDEQSVGAVGLATSTAATCLSSDSALDVPVVGEASHSQSVLESTPDTTETTIPSPSPPAALSQATVAGVYTTSTSPSDSSEHIPDVDVAAGSSTA